MLVKELKPRTPVPEMELEIVSIGETREFANERGSGKVCSAAAKDTKGDEVSLTLWNEQIEEYGEGDKVKLLNGWCSEFKGTVQVTAGKKGSLEKM